MDTIFVKAAQVGRPVWDRDARHPNGEVWIDSDTPIEVGKTPVILSALAANRIIEVPAPRPAPVAQTPKRK